MATLKQAVNGFLNATARRLKGRTLYGVVQSATENDAGQTAFVNVVTDKGVLVQNAASGGYNLSEGTRVRLKSEGLAGSESFTVERPIRPAMNQQGDNPNAIVETPGIAGFAEFVTFLQGGIPVLWVAVIVWQIQAQWRQGVAVGYELEMRSLTEEQPAQTLGIAAQKQILGQLSAAIDNDDVTIPMEPVTGYSNAFPPRFGYIEIENEIIYYDTCVLGSSFTGALRAQDTPAGLPTVAAAHPDTALIRGRSVGFALSNVPTDRSYEYRVRAVIGQQVSNWSDWTVYAAGGDTTAPGWSGSVGLSIVSSGAGLSMTWNAADTNADDVAYYEIQDSIDGSTPVSTFVTGKAQALAYPARYGTARFFRVRAVDTSGNASAWSAWQQAGALPGSESLGATLVTNATFNANVNNWTFATLGAGSKNHDTAIYFSGGGSMRLDESRDAGLQRTLDVTSDPFTVVAASEFYARVMLHMDGYTDTADVIAATIRNASTNVPYASIDLKGAQVASGAGEWTAVILQGFVPTGVTSLEVVITGTLDLGAGATSLWLDEVFVVQPAQLSTLSPTQLQIGGGATVTGLLRGATTWNPGSVAAGGRISTTVTVTGAALGDAVIGVGLTTLNTVDGVLQGVVSAADTVTVWLVNNNTGVTAIDYGSGTLSAIVMKF